MALAEVPRHRFTVEEYHRMGAVGLLPTDARVELIDGEVIDMSPIGVVHNGVVDRMAATLQRALQGLAVVRVQGSVRLSDLSEPQPDLALLAWRDDYYVGKVAGPHDVIALVEVGDSSSRTDRRLKVPLYARSGVTEVWLVDLEAWAIEVLTRPVGEGYEQRATADTTLTVLGVDVAEADLLGPRPSG